MQPITEIDWLAKLAINNSNYYFSSNSNYY